MHLALSDVLSQFCVTLERFVWNVRERSASVQPCRPNSTRSSGGSQQPHISGEKTERSGFCSTMRVGGPDALQKSKKNGFENFWGDSEYEEVRVVSGFLDYVCPTDPLYHNSDFPVNETDAALPSLTKRSK